MNPKRSMLSTFITRTVIILFSPFIGWVVILGMITDDQTFEIQLRDAWRGR